MQGTRQRGFTLIELMVATAIVALLASLAYPSYTKYVIKSNRTAAQAQMLDIANREQQFLMINKAYASASTLETSGYSLPSTLSAKYSYSVNVGTGTVPSFSKVKDAIAERGWKVTNIDSTVIAQAPKLAPYVNQMVAHIAADLGASPDGINIKATTTEKLGFAGREEGIAAHAVVLLEHAGK